MVESVLASSCWNQKMQSRAMSAGEQLAFLANKMPLAMSAAERIVNLTAPARNPTLASGCGVSSYSAIHLWITSNVCMLDCWIWYNALKMLRFSFSPEVYAGGALTLWCFENLLSGSKGWLSAAPTSCHIIVKCRHWIATRIAFFLSSSLVVSEMGSRIPG